jgi:hypothetical protein
MAGAGIPMARSKTHIIVAKDHCDFIGFESTFEATPLMTAGS